MTSRSHRFVLLAGLLSLALAGSAAGEVVVNNATTAVSPVAINDTFTVTVRAVWDGQGALQGIFTSTGYDANVVQFVSATSAPAAILQFNTGEIDPDTGDPIILPGLNRLLQPSILNGFLRTVQYAVGSADNVVDPRAANAPAGRLITTLTFKALANGTTTIAPVLGGTADPGAVGDTFRPGTTVTVTVPEPGSILLGGVALSTVLSVVAIRRRIV